jgi:hypothetical protein
MSRRYVFASAYWFRWPLRALVIAVSVFALVTLYPALADGTQSDLQRALFGLLVVGVFVVIATVVSVAIDDSYIEIDDHELTLRFEGFFGMKIPLENVTTVEHIAPAPRWRYRWGLSTDWTDRIACSHGGALVEVKLARPQRARLWPRDVPVRRLWLGVREPDAFIAHLASRARPPAQVQRAA